jgi:CO/xanthine dehydrogenase Mo-binding subunit
MNGNAGLRAAEELKAKIVSAAAKRMQCAAEDVILRDDFVFKRGTVPAEDEHRAHELLRVRETRKIESGQILRDQVQMKRRSDETPDYMTFEEAVAVALSEHRALTGTGSYAPPQEARGGKHKGGGVGPSPAYSYSAQVAEVSVDEETGIVTVHKVWAAHDCGRALNPVSVEGQVIGSVWMGLGQALQEEMVWKDGLLMNPGLLEYRSASAIESPEIEAIIVESIDPEGPFGAKEASEGSLAAAIPAVANAIYDAVGVRMREAPFTPERVLAALRAQRNEPKKIDMTEGVDPTAPKTFREHGGSLWFKGKGPKRHANDPAVRKEQPAGD